MRQTVLLALGLAALLGATVEGQTTVGVSTPEADITVTTDDAMALASSVIESSLRGVGRMLGAMRGTDPGPAAGSRSASDDVQVRFDDQLQRYAVTTAEGPRIWVDAQSGAYSIDLQGATHLPGALIEESLATVGSMIRGLRKLNGPGADAIDQATDLGNGPLGLSPIEIDRLQRIWRSEGLSAVEIERRQAHLESADASFRAAVRALDDSMDLLDREMEELQRQMEALDRQFGGGGGR